jgi:type III restriction enzyme
MMRLKFDPALAYQIDAVNAVADIFAGQPSGLDLRLADERFVANVHHIQDRNGIPRSETEGSALKDGREFSVEMETGTGKTYVYLRSLFELNKRYGFKKFVIVVPSVAIREGVLKSIELMREHFAVLFDSVPFNSFIYDSKRPGAVRQFAESNHVQVMIINIQAFVKDLGDAEALDDGELRKLNVIYRDDDRMGGKPIDFIRAARPIVIIDEPQSADTTPKSRHAISQLNPAVTLRYSATHRTPYNLLYRLGPIEAYDRRLVKRIEVASITADQDFSDAYLKLLQTDNTAGIKAQLEIHRLSGGSPKPVKVWVRQGDDLFTLSHEHFPYRQGFIVQNIDSTPGVETVEFNQGQVVARGQSIGGTEADVMRAMIAKTIEHHLNKECAVKGRGIKVLSLFFIDKVANYRLYHADGSTSLGKIGRMFEEAYRDLAAKPMYKDLLAFDVEDLHDGYFSRDKKGGDKDTRGNTADDDGTYALIMRDKERLLDPKLPLRFIFSHTALREGWDNPNVFQICTLREIGSERERRQQIGRGLRLPVNQHGERVHDEDLNRLTVIAGESYQDFAAALQSEYERDLGVKFDRIANAATPRDVRCNTQIDLPEDFRALWSHISPRTRFRLRFDTVALIDDAACRLKAMEAIQPLVLTATRVDVDFTQAGVNADRVLDTDTKGLMGPTHLPDTIAYLQKETELTRHTLVAILQGSGRIGEFRLNPQHFMAQAARAIGSALHDLMLEGILFEKITDDVWEMRRIEDDAADLDGSERIKLPRGFKIDTPLGAYSPDWVFVTERNERLYFFSTTARWSSRRPATAAAPSAERGAFPCEPRSNWR